MFVTMFLLLFLCIWLWLALAWFQTSSSSVTEQVNDLRVPKQHDTCSIPASGIFSLCGLFAYSPNFPILCCLKKRNVNMESHWAAFTVHLYGCFSHEDGLWFPVDLFMDECRCFNYICAYFRLFGCLGEQPRACFQTSVSSSTSQTW